MLLAAGGDPGAPGRTVTYGEDTGPMMSMTAPTGFRFSSITVSPMRGRVSAFRTRFRLELT
jgi:hypothetical protein